MPERLLIAAELGGFALVPISIGLAIAVISRPVLGLAAGLFVAGVALVYLANAYALPSAGSSDVEATPDAQR